MIGCQGWTLPVVLQLYGLYTSSPVPRGRPLRVTPSVWFWTKPLSAVDAQIMCAQLYMLCRRNSRSMRDTEWTESVLPGFLHQFTGFKRWLCYKCLTCVFLSTCCFIDRLLQDLFCAKVTQGCCCCAVLKKNAKGWIDGGDLSICRLAGVALCAAWFGDFWSCDYKYFFFSPHVVIA